MANLGSYFSKIPQGPNKGAQNFITIAPGLADANIATTYELLSAGTNYFQVVVQPGGEAVITDIEVRTAMAYRDAFRQGDVVTALNNVYNNLQSTYFANTGCSFDTISYWAQKFLYSNKELISLNNHGATFGEKILPNLNPAVSNSLVGGFINGLRSQISQFASGVNAALGGILGGSTLADAGVPNQSYLDNFSDSIGLLANTKYLQLDSTLPIFDVSQNFYGVPITYSASTENKISNNTRNISYNLSIGCTALMRRNLLNVAYTQPMVASNMASDATVAHGLNLINDLPTFAQLNAALPKLVDRLQSVFKVPKVFQYIQYLCTIGNKCGVNLRDIFPVTPQDKDFVVVASADRALASEQEIKSISDDAIIQSYAEQQGVNYANSFGGAGVGGSAAAYQPGGAGSVNVGGAVGSSQTINPDGSITVNGELRRNNDGNTNPPAGDATYQGQTASGIPNNDPNIPGITAPLGSGAKPGDVVWVEASNSQGSNGFYAVVNDLGPSRNGWGEMGQSALSQIPGANVPANRDAVSVPSGTVTTIKPIGQRIPTGNVSASTTAFNNIKNGGANKAA
jgi:hypothetical protein